MVLLSGALFFALLSLVSSKSIGYNDPIYGQPEQVHLSYGRKLFPRNKFRILLLILVDPSLMIVTWVTLNEVNDSIVEYGQFDMLENRTTGYVSIFQDSGSEQRREYIHRVVLRNLIPGQKYCMK